MSSYQNQMREALWVNIMIFWNSALDLSFQAAMSFYLGFLWGKKKKKLETLLKAEKQPLKQHWSITGTNHQSDMSQ